MIAVSGSRSSSPQTESPELAILSARSGAGYVVPPSPFMPVSQRNMSQSLNVRLKLHYEISELANRLFVVLQRLLELVYLQRLVSSLSVLEGYIKRQ